MSNLKAWGIVILFSVTVIVTGWLFRFATAFYINLIPKQIVHRITDYWGMRLIDLIDILVLIELLFVAFVAVYEHSSPSISQTLDSDLIENEHHHNHH